MPLQPYNPLITNSRLALWKVTEDLEGLHGILKSMGREDLLPLPRFKHDRRNAEWMAVRCAVTSALSPLADIFYTNNGKPHLKGIKGEISISHAWPFVCFFYHPTLSTGVDIERIDKRILRVAGKFIGEEEEKWLNRPYDINELYYLWSAKEAAFKLLGGGGIDFRKHLNVHRINLQDTGKGVIEFNKDERRMTFDVYYQFLDSMILVYTIANNEAGQSLSADN